MDYVDVTPEELQQMFEELNGGPAPAVLNVDDEETGKHFAKVIVSLVEATIRKTGCESPRYVMRETLRAAEAVLSTAMQRGVCDVDERTFFVLREAETWVDRLMPG